MTIVVQPLMVVAGDDRKTIGDPVIDPMHALKALPKTPHEPPPERPMKLALPILILALAVPSLAQNRGGGGGFGSATGRFVARAADSDNSGEVSEAEWKAFVASLPEVGEGELDRQQVLALMLITNLDQDKNGSLSKKDLKAIFVSRDADENGSLSSEELQGRRAGYMNRIALERGDANWDHELSAAEWKAFLAAIELGDEDAIGVDIVKSWIEGSKDDGRDAEPGALTPGVYLLTLNGNLDADRNSKVTADDLQQLFAALDQNSDSILQADELTTRARGRGNRGGGGRRGGAAADPGPRISPEAKLKPPLVKWQRSLDDALAISQSTGKPILICVNMDGESASERLAWLRYRDPEFAKLAAGFVPLIVSPDRRNKRDHDDRGRRIPDKRFGRVINAEHIDIEPELFKRYFSDQRMAPRHVGVDKDGNILFDIFLTNDMKVVDESLAKHGKPSQDVRDPSSMDKSALLSSPEALHREFLEALFLRSEVSERVRLTNIALSASRSTQHPELLRLALADTAEKVRSQALRSLVNHAEKVPLDIFSRAFFLTYGNPGETAGIIDALHRVAASSEDETKKARAQRLMRVHAGMASQSRLISKGAWRQAMNLQPLEAERSAEGDDFDSLEGRLDELEKLRVESPGDSQINTMVAEANMRFAQLQLRESRDPTFSLEDVRSSALRAIDAGSAQPKAWGYLAWASYMLSDIDAAVSQASVAIPLLQGQANSALAADVMQVFVQGRTRALYQAMADGSEWPASWIPDIRAAHEIMLMHPSATEEKSAAYLDFLSAIEAFGEQAIVLRRELLKYPIAARLHEHLRSQVLNDEGASALEAVYETLDCDPEDRPAMLWFSGLASFVAGEHLMENLDRESAQGAYERSISKFEGSIDRNPDFKSSAGHYICLSAAGLASLYVAEERLEDAVAVLVKGINASPASAEIKNSTDTSAKDVAQDLSGKLRRSGLQAQAQELGATLIKHSIVLPPR